MYRPQKHKDKALKDSRNATKTPLEGDDRNIVAVDDAFGEADIEDRMWLYWQKNRHLIIGGIVLALIAVLAVAGFRVYQEASHSRMQQAYASAQTEGDLLAFGKQYANRTLGGFALLEVADQAFEDGKFDEARGLYRQAATSLSGSAFGDRALLGAGIAAIKSGDKAAGEDILGDLGRRANALEAVRAEAAYYLALLAADREDFSTARLWIERIEAMQFAGIWGQQAAFLRMSHPAELGE